MAAKGGGTNWGYIFGGIAIAVTVAINILGFLTSGTEKLEKRVSKIEDDMAWKFVTRDFAAKDIGYIERNIHELKAGKVDRDVYELTTASLDRRLSLLREAVRELERLARRPAGNNPP